MDTELLRIAINAQINPNSPGGVESNLLSLLMQLSKTPTQLKYHLLCLEQPLKDIVPFMGTCQKAEIWPFPQVGYVPAKTELSGRWAKLQRVLPDILVHRIFQAYGKFKSNLTSSTALTDEFLTSREIKAVHFPYPLYFRTGLPFLYEPWDLQHRHYPEFFEPGEVAWRDQLYQWGCQRAKLVVTATKWTKQDLIQQYGIPAEKIAVIPRSSLLFRDKLSPEARLAAKQQYGLPDQFALYPAMTFPHKNHIRLLTSLARLRDEQGITLPLICTGRIYKPHWPKVEETLHKLNLEAQVQFLGAVSYEKLCALFSTASFMVFPSLFEGLGLPLLEAMHHGLPILAARNTCIPEVIGDAGLLFEGESEDAILDSLLTACKYPEHLSEISDRRTEVLEHFSWERAAPIFMACYQWVAGAPLSTVDQTLFNQAVYS